MNKPTFYFEKRLWKEGFKYIAGCDEVGRGCFAGPVITGCVIFSPETIYTLQGASFKGVKVDDSKKLTLLQREKADKWIKENCISWGIGMGSVAEINKLGISKATFSAFRRAIKNVNEKLVSRVEYLLIDAYYVPYIRELRMPYKTKRLRNRKILYKGQQTFGWKKHRWENFSGNQLAIIKGDQKSFSIAAASIIAKVYRDNLMKSLSKKYKDYGWEENKGYGTKKHCEAIKKYNISKHHRKSFVETYLKNSFSFQARSKT